MKFKLGRISNNAEPTDKFSEDGLFLLLRLDTGSTWPVTISARSRWHPLQVTAALLLFNHYSTLKVILIRARGIGGTTARKESRLGRL
jgi:hypothetical protein